MNLRARHRSHRGDHDVPVVELRGIEKSFGTVRAVDGVDFVAPAGKLTAIVGPSGCGKTTLLRLIAGFETPDRGTISIGGTTVAADRLMVPTERRRVGMVFQQFALFPHLDVAGNITYGLRSLDRRARRERLAELLDLVDLKGLEKRQPNELSGGQAQRVAVARALAPRPEVVLLDEPFSSLDVSLRAGVRAEVRDILRREGVTAILVTHDQDEALSLGDEVAVLFAGRVAQAGAPEAVYRRPSSVAVAAFLGDANVVAAEVRDGMVRTEVGDAPIAEDSAEGATQALIRTEDLDLDEGGTGVVQGAEYYGHDQLVTVRLVSGTLVRARLHARRRLAPGTPVTVRIVADSIQVFDDVRQVPPVSSP